MNVKEFGIPIILLSATWGAFDVILKSLEIQNRIRDTWTGLKHSHAERVAIFWSDWFWLWLGTLWFLIILTVVIVMMPRLVSHEKSQTPKSSQALTFEKRLCWFVATLPSFAFIGVLIGGILDMQVCFKS